MKCELRVAFSSWAEAAAGVWRVAAAVMALSRRELRASLNTWIAATVGRVALLARLSTAATALLFRHYRAGFNTWVHAARELAVHRRLLSSFAHDVRACRRALNTWHGAAEEWALMRLAAARWRMLAHLLLPRPLAGAVAEPPGLLGPGGVGHVRHVWQR